MAPSAEEEGIVSERKLSKILPESSNLLNNLARHGDSQLLKAGMHLWGHGSERLSSIIVDKSALQNKRAWNQPVTTKDTKPKSADSIA